LADVARLYDNSSYSNPFRAVAQLRGGAITPMVDPLPESAEALLSDIT